MITGIKCPFQDVFESIGFWYLLVAVINSAVSFLWFFHLSIFAFVGLLWQLATLVFIYHRLRDYPPRNGTDHAFVNAPFSIYTAYSFFIVLWQIFQFNDQTKHNDLVCIQHHLIYAMFTYLNILRCLHASLSLSVSLDFIWLITPIERTGFTP